MKPQNQTPEQDGYVSYLADFSLFLEKLQNGSNPVINFNKTLTK